MRIETVPLIVGVLVGLLGLALLFDAWTPDETIISRERRRRPRAERSRSGEGWLGVGVLAMGAAFLGRDSWAWSNVAVMAGIAAAALGVWLNRRYFAQAISNRGKLRRGLPATADASTSAPTGAPSAPTRAAPPDVLREGRMTAESSAPRDPAPPPQPGPSPRYRIR